MAKWSIPFLKRRQEPEFKPDASGSSFRKVLHMTYQQRLTYLRWGLYIAVCLLALGVLGLCGFADIVDRVYPVLGAGCCALFALSRVLCSDFAQ